MKLRDPTGLYKDDEKIVVRRMAGLDLFFGGTSQTNDGLTGHMDEIRNVPGLNCMLSLAQPFALTTVYRMPDCQRYADRRLWNYVRTAEEIARDW